MAKSPHTAEFRATVVQEYLSWNVCHPRSCIAVRVAQG